MPDPVRPSKSHTSSASTGNRELLSTGIPATDSSAPLSERAAPVSIGSVASNDTEGPVPHSDVIEDASASQHKVTPMSLSPTVSMSALDFLSFCRVQNHVAKNAIVAYRNPTAEGAEVEFLVANFIYVSERM